MSTDDYYFMNEIFQQTGDFLRYATPEQKASTAAELLLTGNLLPAQDIEEIRRTGNYEAIVPTMINNWFRDPVQGSIDLLTGALTAAGGLGAGLKLGGRLIGKAGKSEWKKVGEKFAPYSIDLTDSKYAAIQYTARKLNSTFDKVRKEVNLLTDMTPEELAKNKVIELYAQGLDLYKKGEIFPLTQADAKGACKILDELDNNEENFK